MPKPHIVLFRVKFWINGDCDYQAAVEELAEALGATGTGCAGCAGGPNEAASELPQVLAVHVEEHFSVCEEE